MADEESRIVEMLEHKSKCINIIDDRWISDWAALIEKHFHNENRNHIRLKAIAILSQIFSKYHIICEDELMSKIILPYFNDVDQENDSVVKKPIVHLLFDVASACLSYKHCNAILAIIRKILNKPFIQKSEESSGLVYIIGNVDIIDSRLIISNLNKLFRTELFRLPIDPAVNILDISVNYLNLTYKCPLQDPTPAEIPMIRKELFNLFLNLRCNKHGHLGIMKSANQDLDEIEYSPFIICVRRPQRTSSSSSSSSDQLPSPLPPDSPTLQNAPILNQFHPQLPTQHPTQQASNLHQNQRQQQAQHQLYNQSSNQHNIFVPSVMHPNCPIVSRCINLDAMFGGIVECIAHETDLDVLKFVLDGLPALLSNRSLVLTATTDRINQLCIALSDLTKSGRMCRSKSDLRCLTSLLIYRKLLDHKSIKVMLAAFEDSLKTSRYLIVPLFTTCLIELRDSSEMTKFLPLVLDKLSKFSPHSSLGIGMLEFLSYLILFPKLYENFSEDEYKFIFAIALPYTNPFRFSDYITCLAFRVIAMWYLNCRPSLRCAFVEFVKKSLQSNVIQPFKENNHSSSTYSSQIGSPITQTPPITYSCPATISPIDQRKRSSSLNTENSFKAQQAALNLPSPQSSLQINEELIETFADLLSRYTHGQCLAIAPKNRSIEQLVDRNTSQTWLHGNSLITITSGRSSHGWAEIMIRRPTGNTSWVGRLHNASALPSVNQQVYLDSLNFGNDVLSLFSSLSPATDDSSVEYTGSTPNLSSGSSLGFVNSPSLLINYSTSMGKFRDPTPLPKDKKSDIALSNFDHITPYETHKVGVVYVGKGQASNRAAILSNRCGSIRYFEFLRHIGTCIVLKDIDPEIYFIGGLDVNGDDGKFAYFWKDNVTQVIFHVATLMPARENDPQCNNKNRHIGNDNVCIIYNDSNEQFHMSTIKGIGQILMACIVIRPLQEVASLVEVQMLPDLKDIVGEFEPKVLTDLGASLYARQTAIHLNLASKILKRRQCEGFVSNEPYVSNWVERLRCIKRIRQRLDESRKPAASTNSVGRGMAVMK